MANVEVDDKAITALGEKFTQWATNTVDPLIKGLDGVALTPGDFEDATKLKNTVTERTASLKKNLTGISKALADIGTELKKVAAVYAKTGDDTTITAKGLDDLVKALEADLPGLKK